MLHQVSIEEARDHLAKAVGKEAQEMILPVTFRPAVELAIYSHDQLRTIAGIGGAAHLSFDQTAVEAVARMHGLKIEPENARDLAILQSEGLKLLREQT